MLFHPQLRNGEYVKFTWLQRFSVWNLLGWPLADDASNWMRNLIRLYSFVAFIIFCLFNDAEFRYIRQNLNNMGVALSAVPVLLVLVESQVRNFHMAMQKQDFKGFIKEFYDKIYISESEQSVHYEQIQRKFVRIVVFACSYCIALILFVVIAIYDISRGQPFSFLKITFHFDHMATLHRNVPTVGAYLWIAFTGVAMFIGETNILALTILHLNARYKILQEDLLSISANLLQTKNDAELALNFRNELVKMIRQNADLNEFAGKVEKTFSFRIFVNFANSSLMICVLGFRFLQTGITWEGGYILSWLIAKIIEALIIGELGTTLMFTTNQLPSMYYHSNWELILVHSKDTKANVVAMKTIVVAMELNQNPICLTGMNYFSVTVATVLKILQGASSYFMWLTAVNKL